MADTFAQTFNQNAVSQTVYRWRDLNRNDDYDPGEVNLDVNSGGDFISTTAAANNVFNPGPSAARSRRSHGRSSIAS